MVSVNDDDDDDGGAGAGRFGGGGGETRVVGLIPEYPSPATGKGFEETPDIEISV